MYLGISKEVISTTVAEMPVSSFVRIAGLSGALAVSLGNRIAGHSVALGNSRTFWIISCFFW